MAATFGKYPSLDKQWRKMMFSFYPYLSTKNRNATQEEWKIRRLIWDFKDGKAFANVAHLVANKLIQLYGKETNNIIFACVPASSAEKNEKRYKHFHRWFANFAECTTLMTILRLREKNQPSMIMLVKVKYTTNKR